MQSDVQIIGLAGKAGSGKDTACEFIKRWGIDHSYAVQREGFADRLKISAARALGAIHKDAIDFCNELKQHGTITISGRNDGEDFSITGREYLQFYGTEAHRDVFSDDFWVEQVLDREYTAAFLVITDVRFPNEAAAIKERGGIVWQLDRKGSGAGTHASEQQLSMELIDKVISNNGSFGELQERVWGLMNEQAVEREFAATAGSDA